MTLDQKTGLYGAYDFIYDPFFTKPWFIALSTFIGIVIITSFGYFIYSIIKKSRKNLETPLMLAQKKLKELSTTSFNEADLVSSAAFEEIIFIMKQYWQQKTKQEIMQYTPQEFSFIIRHYCQNAATKNEIDDFFSLMEHFLFAQHESTLHELTQCSERAATLLKKIDA